MLEYRRDIKLTLCISAQNHVFVSFLIIKQCHLFPFRSIDIKDPITMTDPITFFVIFTMMHASFNSC